MQKLFQVVQPYYQVSFAMVYNARVYEPLCCNSALLSSYHKVTKRTNLSKPAASNGLYTLLAAGFYFFNRLFVILPFRFLIISILSINESNFSSMNLTTLGLAILSLYLYVILFKSVM
jgi:hypothetical protein